MSIKTTKSPRKSCTITQHQSAKKDEGVTCGATQQVITRRLGSTKVPCSFTVRQGRGPSATPLRFASSLTSPRTLSGPPLPVRAVVPGRSPLCGAVSRMCLQAQKRGCAKPSLPSFLPSATVQKRAQRRVDTVQRTVQHTTQRCYLREILLFQKLVSCPFKKVNGFSCPRPRNAVNYSVAWWVALRVALERTLRRTAPHF